MAELISRTGRVQSWIDDPDGRLPVSAPSLLLMTQWKDLMESKQAGVLPLMHSAMALDVRSTFPNYDREEAIMVMDLLLQVQYRLGESIASLNETLRRGGKYKNGAVVLHLDANHKDIDEFITTPREQLAWVKRCVNITEEWWEDMDVNHPPETNQRNQGW